MTWRGAPRVCSGGWRALRGLVVALVALMLAVGGHVSGGGAFPSWTLFVPLWGAASLLGWILSGRRLTGRDLLGVLLLVQAVMHLSCALDSPAADMRLTGPMLAGHAVATTVSVYVLRRGEDVVWMLAELLLLGPVRLLAGSEAYSGLRTASSIRVWLGAPTLMARLRATLLPQRAPPSA